MKATPAHSSEGFESEQSVDNAHVVPSRVLTNVHADRREKLNEFSDKLTASMLHRTRISRKQL